MKRSVIIVAGGSGSRMNAPVPKQFLLLAGKPLLMHAVAAFSDAFPGLEIVVALPQAEFARWRELCSLHGFDIPHRLVAGGETRFHSVKNALELTGDEGIVAIHDGARPLVSPMLIREAFLVAAEYGNCIPVVPVNESVRCITDGTSRPVDRHELRIVQTPQVFLCSVIKQAYGQDFRPEFTDEATVAESAGVTIHLIDGDPVNFKITRPSDLAAAEAIFQSTAGSR